MLSVPYYHSLLKKYVIIFGTLFNNIRIERFNADNTVASTLKVPIAYGPRDKFLARIEANPTGTATTSILLPRMGFELTGIRYASDRKLQTTIPYYTNQNLNGNSILRKVYQPVPYDIEFTLSVIAKSTEDAARIVEQILPYFTPEWTISARLLENFDNLTDIPVIINTVDIEDNYESDFKTRRTLIYTMVFTMKAYLYGPSTQSKIIKIANINTFAPIEATKALNKVTIQPGLDANGNPTTVLADTISYLSIDETDDFNYVVTTTDFPND